MLRTPLASSLALAVLSLAASAGTHTVAKAPGPGVDFTTIQAAVDAAVDGDLILVAPGTYEEHVVIDGKSLVLAGNAEALIAPPFGSASLAPALTIRNLASDQAVDVRDLSVWRTGTVPAPAVRLADNAGRVWFEEAALTCFTGAAVSVEDCADVMLSEVTANALNALDLGGVVVGQPALFVDSYGHAGVVQSTLGGSHFGPPANPFALADGGPGALIVRGDVAFDAVSLTGGNGNSSFVGSCPSGGSGGSALELGDGVGVPLLVRTRDVVLRAGKPGPYDPNCATAPAPAAVVVDPGGFLAKVPGTVRELELEALSPAGSSIDVVVRGEAFDVVALFIGMPVVGQPAAAFQGDLWLDFGNAKYMTFGIADAAGVMQKSFPAPFPMAPIQARAQGFTAATDGSWHLTTPASTMIF